MKKNLLSLLCFFSCLVNLSIAQTTGDYRSKQSGTWSTSANWETFNGSTWISATSAPSSSSGIITIQSGHDITSSGTLTIDQVVVNNGGTITISAGTFTISDATGTDLSCSGTVALSLSGTMNGSGSIVIQSGGNFNWTGGNNGGAGSLTVNAGATFTMSSFAHYLQNSKTINNSGTLNWTGGALQYDGGSPAIVNTGTFNINTDAAITDAAVTTGTFTNQQSGVINKTGAPPGPLNQGTLIDDLSLFTNEGTINITSGKLDIRTNSTQSGTINVSFGAVMGFSDLTSTFNDGASFSSTGTIDFDGATVAINSPLTSLTTTVNLSDGSITGPLDVTMGSGSIFNLSGSGELNNSGTLIMGSGSIFNWSASDIGGNGTLIISEGATFNIISPTNTHFLFDAIVINNYGTCNWTGSHLDYEGGNPAINNFGTFNINTDVSVRGPAVATGTFTNMPGGVITKTGAPTGETKIDDLSMFTNQGTINVISGKFEIWSPSTQSGTITVALGASISFSDKITTFNGVSNMNGTGKINFNGATIKINAPLTISSSTVNLSTDTLQGVSTLTINSGAIFNWTGGYNGGTGLLEINQDATLILDGGVNLIGSKVINNYGTWTWSSGNIQYKVSNPAINNFGTFNINTDNDVTNSGTIGTGTFTNHPGAVITKTGINETTFSGFGTFNNSGTININSGHLKINVGGTNNGTYIISAGTELRGTINMAFTGSALTNNGNITLTGLTFSGTSSQIVTGTGSINTLTINNASGLTLGGKQTINTTLTLTNGKITIGDHNLVLGSATLTGGSASSYIVTSGTGSLTRKVTGTKTFPVGHGSSYLPITMQLTGSSDTFKIRVLPNLYGSFEGSNNPVGNAIPSNSVNATWLISESSPGSSSCNVTFQWNGSDEGLGFNRSSSRAGLYTGGVWDLGAATAASGSNPYTVIRNGISTFSAFGITNQFVSCPGNFGPLCKGVAISVPYTAAGTFNGGNVFTAQLSNSSGSFSSPTAIGTVSSVVSGAISATIPTVIAKGSGYRIRVTSNNPSFTSSDNASNISIGVTVKYFQDLDGDTYGNKLVSQTKCSGPPAGYVTDSTDCNDNFATGGAIHPGVSEICNSIDDNCNTQIDEGLTTTYYADIDDDGFGDLASPIVACFQPANYVLNNTDCNDGDTLVNPDEYETCNGIDDNCDGNSDEISAIYYYSDNTSGIPNYISANATGSNLMRVNGAVTPSFPCSNGGFSSKYFTNTKTFNTSLPAIEFIIAPTAGFNLLATSFSVDLRRSASGPVLVRYAYSLDDGINWVDSEIDDTLEYTACGLITNYTWDFDDFSPGETLKFRIYGYDASGILGTLQLMNLSLNGQVCPAAADADGDGFTIAQGDCDDNNEEIYPGAADICNGIDDNCVAGIDENIITATISPSGSVSTCSGTTALLTASPGSGVTYKWLKNSVPISGATNSTYSAATAGSYIVVENNGFLCTDTSAATSVTILPLPPATISTPGGVDLCASGSVLLQANTGTNLSYQWKKGASNIAGATNSSYTATTTGTYRVEVTRTTTGCKKLSTGVSVIKSCKESSFTETKIYDAFSIYPNPTSGKLMLELTINSLGNVDATIEVLNTVGQMVYSENVLCYEGLMKHEVSLNHVLADGIYIVKVVIDDQLFARQIVLQK